MRFSIQQFLNVKEFHHSARNSIQEPEWKVEEGVFVGTMNEMHLAGWIHCDLRMIFSNALNHNDVWGCGVHRDDVVHTPRFWIHIDDVGRCAPRDCLTRRDHLDHFNRTDLPFAGNNP